MENDYVKYVIDGGWIGLGGLAFSKNFTDKTGKVDYCLGTHRHPFVTATKHAIYGEGGPTGYKQPWYTVSYGEPGTTPTSYREHPSTSVSYSNGRIEVEIGRLGVTAVIDVTVRDHYMTFTLSSLSDSNLESFTLSNLNLNISEHVGRILNIGWNKDFAACVLTLNNQVNSYGGSAEHALLMSRCYKRYGLLGASIALIGAPTSQIRSVIKEVEVDYGLPHPKLNGVWAKASQDARKSYLFAHNMKQANVEEFIRYAKMAGFEYILILERNCLATSGSYKLNETNFPDGLSGLKEVVDKIHTAGMKAGLHIRLSVVDKDSQYVTPIPDSHLVKIRSVPLGAPIDAEATFIPTAVPPFDFPERIIKDRRGFPGKEYGSDLQIGNEIIVYNGLSLSPPFGFKGCRRGAHGTEAATHSPGSTPHIYHLLDIHGSYVFDADSPLLDEVLDACARVFNGCGFDMIYLDASELVQDDAWHYVTKVQKAIYDKIGREDILVEASSFTNYTWHMIANSVTMDGVRRDRKQYIDRAQISGLLRLEDNLIPGNLGWFHLFSDTPPDVVEYLCCKSIGYDAGIALRCSTKYFDKNPKIKEILEMFKNYETLRLQNYFSEEEKAKLRRPGAEYRLTKDEKGKWKFLPV